MAMTLPTSPHYFKNLERFGNGDDPPCAICGKGVKRGNEAGMVHIHGGGGVIVTEEEARERNARDGDGGDLGGFPVGRECLRNHPEIAPYVVRAHKEATV